MLGQFQEPKGLESISGLNQFQATTPLEGGTSHQHYQEGNYYSRLRLDFSIFRGFDVQG